MKPEMNKQGKIQLDMFDIITEVIENMPNERMWEMIEQFGWHEKIFTWVSKALAEEFSRKNYDPMIHEERKKFLQKVKKQEIEYYAELIAARVEDEARMAKAYWKLYRWCSDNHIFRTDNGSYEASEFRGIDFDYRDNLVAIINEALSKKVEEVKDAGKETC